MGSYPSCSPLNVQQYSRHFEAVFRKNDSEMKKSVTMKQCNAISQWSKQKGLLREVSFRTHRSYNQSARAGNDITE